MMASIAAASEQATAAQPDLEELRVWAAQQGGVPISEMRRISAGSSRAMYLLTRPGSEDWVLRVDPVAGTELTLEREAELYRVLVDQPILVPRFKGLHPGKRAFVMTRVAGEHELSTLDENSRAKICDRFIDALADVHRIDTTVLDLPSFRPVRGPRDHALSELDLWQGILEDRLTGDLGLGRAAFALLRWLAPEYHGPTVLCHGDVGPKNFMFDDGRITAIIDWENAHLGDPMDDLAWWIFRGHEWLGVAGRLSDQLARWSRQAGMPIDTGRLVYYRAFVLLRWYIEIRTGLSNGGSSQDRAPYLRLIPAIDIKLAQALAQLLGHDLGPLPALEASAESFGTDAIAALRSDLTDHILPALEDPEARRRATSGLEYLSHLEAAERFGPAIRIADAEERATLPSRLANPDAADWTSAAAATADHQGKTDMVAFLRFAMRRGGRHAYLWPMTLARARDSRWADGALPLED
jgi:aminoglycoside phosphotransferase (APT) family kinase protein